MTSILAAGGDNQGVVRQQVYQNPDSSILPVVSSIQLKWRTDFSTPATVPAKWDVGQTGTGMAYSVANGWLSVTTGTTLDDEMTFLSKENFTVPMRAMIAVNLSQRIVGQTASLEFVSVDSAGVPDGWATMAWRLDGTSATTGIYEVATGGMPRLMSTASTIPTTASTGWSVLELESFADEAWFHGRVMDSTNARANSYVRHQQIPDPDRAYKLRIRVSNRQWLDSVTAIVAGTGSTIRITRTTHGLTTNDNVTVANVAGLTGTVFPWTGQVTVVDANNFELNGTTFAGTWINNGWVQFSKNVAPATTTTVGVNYVTILDYTELTAEITAGRGNTAAGQSMAVQVSGGALSTAALQVQGAGSNVASVVPMPTAIALSALPTAFTTARAVAPTTTLVGSLITKAYSIPESDWQFTTSAAPITTTTDSVAKAAGAAGIRNYVTGVQYQNTAATATDLVIKDAATVIWRINAPASMAAPVVVGFATPLKGTAAAALNVAAITTGASINVNLQGYQAP